jgi:hypothetical protein
MVKNGREVRRKTAAGRKGRGGEGGKGKGARRRHSKTAPPPGCKWPTKSRPAILRGVWMASKGAPRFKSLAQFCLVFSKANKDVRCATCASKEGSSHDFFCVLFTLHTYLTPFTLHTYLTPFTLHTISHSIHTTHISHSIHSHYTNISLHSHYTHISFHSHYTLPWWEHDGTQTLGGQHEFRMTRETLKKLNMWWCAMPHIKTHVQHTTRWVRKIVFFFFFFG